MHRFLRTGPRAARRLAFLSGIQDSTRLHIPFATFVPATVLPKFPTRLVEHPYRENTMRDAPNRVCEAASALLRRVKLRNLPASLPAVAAGAHRGGTSHE